MTLFFTALFLVAFFLNFVWEVWHSQLYATCLRMKLPAYIRLITFQSVKDAVWITFFYAVVSLWFGSIFTVTDTVPLAVFIVSLLVFSFVVEWHALRTTRWEYASAMPRIGGVGVSPFVELGVTGVIAVWVVFAIIGV